MKNINIRFATLEDTKEILTVYKPYITDTVITFEYDVPNLNEFKERIINISSEYPYLVCTINDNIVGYAYAHRFKERAAYAWNAELSVYLDQNYTKQGIGKALYTSLINILKLQQVTNVYGCVTSPNPNSDRLHQAFGFELVAKLHNAGYKCNLWHDVVWYEKIIGKHEFPPKPFQSIKEIDQRQLQQILEDAKTYLNKDV